MNRAYKNHGSTHEKTYNWSKLLVGNLIVWLSSAVSFAPLHAVAQTNWKLRPTETGNWSNGDNWDHGLPAKNRDATVDNGGTVEVNTKAEVRNLTIGLQDVNSRVVNDTGGDLEVYGKLFTAGAKIGRHITCNLRGQPVDLGYYSVGFYTDQGNHYNSGHIQFGSAWRF